MVDAINGSTVLDASTQRYGCIQNDVVAKGEKPLSQGQMKTGEGKWIPEERKFTEEEVIDLIEKANKKFTVYDRRFEFSIHEATKQIMVKVIDVNTEEVIREIPPEKILDIVAAIWEVAGIFVDKRI